jgi:hypothetical protein
VPVPPPIATPSSPEPSMMAPFARVASPPKVSTERPVRFKASMLPSSRKVPPDRRAPIVKPSSQELSRNSTLPPVQTSAPIA